MNSGPWPVRSPSSFQWASMALLAFVLRSAAAVPPAPDKLIGPTTGASSALQVGTSRCDVPVRVQRTERTDGEVRIAPYVAPAYAALTAQRAVPTTLTYGSGGEGRGEEAVHGPARSAAPVEGKEAINSPTETAVAVVRFDPVVRDIEGWKVHIEPALLDGEQAAEGSRALAMLANHLQRIKILVPAEPLTKLQAVEIWIEHDHPRLKLMQYHPSREWLRDHDYEPPLAPKSNNT